jgi:hypothetical protein
VAPESNNAVGLLVAQNIQSRDSGEMAGAATGASPGNQPENGGTPAETKTAAPTQSVALTPKKTETTDRRNARKSAEDYLGCLSFSRSGLINQLLHEGFSQAEAVFAVDEADVNLDLHAVGSEGYSNYSASFGRSKVDQILYEGYAEPAAEHGLSSTHAKWENQARKSATSYSKSSSFSRQELIEQLRYDGFSQSEAEYGVSRNGY